MKKSKLIVSFCTLILSLACLTFGVYSAVKTSFTANGTITFNAYGVECDVAIKVVGAEGGDKVLYATTNKTNSKRVAVETRDENAALGLVANYTADSTTVIGGSDTINLGELKFDELNATKSDAERKTITMEVYVINYSNFAIEFQADSDGQNGDGSVTYKRTMDDLGIELAKYTSTDGPTSNVGKNTTCAYSIVFTANSESTSNNAFSVNFTIKPATGKTGADATAYKYLTKNDFETVEKAIGSVEDEETGDLKAKNGKIICCKESVTNTKVLVPLIYCDSDKNIVDESTTGAQLITFESGGTYVNGDIKNEAMFPIQTEIALCEGYEEIGQFLTIGYEDTDAEGSSMISYKSIIQKILLPNTLKTIGEKAFYCCKSLSSVTIPNNVTSIGNWAFNECVSLNLLEIPNSVSSIGSYAFEECEALVSIIIPGSVKTIGDTVFGLCDNLESVTMQEGVTTIGNGAFYYCQKLKIVTIPSTVTFIGYGIFEESDNIQTIICNSPSVGSLYIGTSMCFTPTGGTKTTSRVSTWQTGTGVYTKS